MRSRKGSFIENFDKKKQGIGFIEQKCLCEGSAKRERV